MKNKRRLTLHLVASPIGPRYAFYSEKGKRVFPDDSAYGYRTIAEAMDAYYYYNRIRETIRERDQYWQKLNEQMVKEYSEPKKEEYWRTIGNRFQRLIHGIQKYFNY